MEVEIISDSSTFQKMRDEWNGLASNFHSPLLRHEWFAACIEAFSSKRHPPTIIAVRSGGRLRAAAPLVTMHLGLVPHMEILGAEVFGEPCGFLYDSQAALMTLFQAILERRRSLSLPRFKIEAQEARVLTTMLSTNWFSINRSGASSLRVPLKSTWKEFDASISPGRRSDLRRYRRRAEQYGNVECEVVCPNLETLHPHLQELFRIEASGWKGQSGSAILSSPSNFCFINHYARSAAELGILRLFFLRIGGVTIAARMAVEHSNRLWDLRVAYDEAWSKCAPGVLLTQETLRHAVGCGLEAYEFLGRAEAWERHWPCEEDQYVSMRAYPASAKGQISLLQDGGRLAARKTARIVKGYLSRIPGRRQVQPKGSLLPTHGVPSAAHEQLPAPS
jgi:CelD/BcsL family acetyltransferase involved in cellulose biosynthesis